MTVYRSSELFWLLIHALPVISKDKSLRAGLAFHRALWKYIGLRNIHYDDV